MAGVKKEGQEGGHVVSLVLAREPEAIMGYTRLQKAAQGYSVNIYLGDQLRYPGSYGMQGLVLRHCASDENVMLPETFSCAFKLFM